MAALGWKYLILTDGWPGVVNPNLGKPAGGWDNTIDCCVTNPTYPVGSKLMGYNDSSHNPGGYTMCYMGRADGSFAASFCADLGNIAAPSLGHLVVAHYCGTCVLGEQNTAPWYIVTADCTGSDATFSGAHAAIQCGSMSGGFHDATLVGSPQFGWFWVDGVCPAQTDGGDLTWLWDSSFETNSGEVSRGGDIFIGDDGTNGILIDGTGSAAEQQPCGWSVKSDA